MKAVILAGGLGTRISEETHLKPKPMVEIGGKPILWHIMKGYSAHGVNDFVICCGYKGYLIKEYFANYFLHMSDVTFDMAENRMEVHHRNAEPWRVTLIDTGEDTQTGGRLRAVGHLLRDEKAFCLTYGDGVSDEQKVLVKNIAFDFKDRPADHTSNGVTMGIDGWLYLAIGDFGFMEAEGSDGKKLQFRRGGVVRVRPDGTDLQVYAPGTRNILEVAMSPLLDGFARALSGQGGIKSEIAGHTDNVGDASFNLALSKQRAEAVRQYLIAKGIDGVLLTSTGYGDTQPIASNDDEAGRAMNRRVDFRIVLE